MKRDVYVSRVYKRSDLNKEGGSFCNECGEKITPNEYNGGRAFVFGAVKENGLEGGHYWCHGSCVSVVKSTEARKLLGTRYFEDFAETLALPGASGNTSFMGNSSSVFRRRDVNDIIKLKQEEKEQAEAAKFKKDPKKWLVKARKEKKLTAEAVERKRAELLEAEVADAQAAAEIAKAIKKCGKSKVRALPTDAPLNPDIDEDAIAAAKSAAADSAPTATKPAAKAASVSALKKRKPSMKELTSAYNKARKIFSSSTASSSTSKMSKKRGRQTSVIDFDSDEEWK